MDAAVKEIMDNKIVFDNRYIDEVDGTNAIIDEVLDLFQVRHGWTRKALKTAWDLSKLKRTKFFAGEGINAYDLEAAKQWLKDLALGIYENPLTLQEAFKILKKTEEIFERVKQLLFDWNLEDPTEQAADNYK